MSIRADSKNFSPPMGDTMREAIKNCISIIRETQSLIKSDVFSEQIRKDLLSQTNKLANTLNKELYPSPRPPRKPSWIVKKTQLKSGKIKNHLVSDADGNPTSWFKEVGTFILEGNSACFSDELIMMHLKVKGGLGKEDLPNKDTICDLVKMMSGFVDKRLNSQNERIYSLRDPDGLRSLIDRHTAALTPTPKKIIAPT
jgi:hypothetical protein